MKTSHKLIDKLARRKSSGDRPPLYTYKISLVSLTYVRVQIILTAYLHTNKNLTLLNSGQKKMKVTNSPTEMDPSFEVEASNIRQLVLCIH